MTSEKKYDAKKAACWGALDWLIGKDRSTPLVDLLMRVNSDMNENLSRSFFKALQSNGNYLRIQKCSDLKMELSKAERRILKEMGFICHVEHPHKFISNYLATLETPPE
ncbi:unnamed protein product [Prunus armeniaca]